VRSRLLTGAALSLAAAYALAASRPEPEQAKIDWLLREVGNSAAVFIRNGKEYDAASAVSHLKTKLLFAGRRVQTARQFIVGVASRSEASGKPYEIRLPDGKQGRLETWLLERLAVYEKGESARRPASLPTPGPPPPTAGKGSVEVSLQEVSAATTGAVSTGSRARLSPQ
jgi:hypothetical protein